MLICQFDVESVLEVLQGFVFVPISGNRPCLSLAPRSILLDVLLEIVVIEIV